MSEYYCRRMDRLAGKLAWSSWTNGHQPLGFLTVRPLIRVSPSNKIYTVLSVLPCLTRAVKIVQFSCQGEGAGMEGLLLSLGPMLSAI
jgi:hypothetical protein